MIRAIVSDSDALLSIPEENVIKYLNEHGWSLNRILQGGYLFEHTEGTPIIRIANHACGDYAIRLSECLGTLSIDEDRSELDIFVEMGGNIGR